MKRILVFSVTAFLVGWSGASTGQAVQSGGNAANNLLPLSAIASPAADSAAFLADAFSDGILELAVSELALRKSSNTDIRRFAEKAIVDRTEANDRIRRLAQNRNIALPGQLSADQRMMLENLAALSGNEFDLTYLHHELMTHELQTQLFSKWANTGSDPDVGNIAAHTLQVLQAHLHAARNINRRTHPTA